MCWSTTPTGVIWNAQNQRESYILLSIALLSLLPAYEAKYESSVWDGLAGTYKW